MNIVFVNMRLHFLIISIIKTIMIISPGTTTQSFSCIIRVDDGESLVTDQWVGTGAEHWCQTILHMLVMFSNADNK